MSMTLDRLLQSVADATLTEDAGMVPAPQTRAVVRIRAALIPTDCLHLIADLAQRLPAGPMGPFLNLGVSNAAYALIAELPDRRMYRDSRCAQAAIGSMAVLARGLPKIAGPDDSQMVRPDGPVMP